MDSKDIILKWYSKMALTNNAINKFCGTKEVDFCGEYGMSHFFKYVVQKLAEGGRFTGIIMATPNGKLKYRTTIDLVEGDMLEGVEAESADPNLAWQEALMKLIEEVKDENN